MQKVRLLEVSPRDGLQNESVIFSTAQKIELIARVRASGLSHIEATSFVHPKLVPQMADAEAVMAELHQNKTINNGAHFVGLALNAKGAQRAIAAGVNEIGFSISATDAFGQRNQNMSRTQGLSAWREVVQLAKAANIPAHITISVCFGCPFSGEVQPAQVLELVQEIAACGTHEIALADTIGVGVPAQVAAIFAAAKNIAPHSNFRGHFHNTRNMAVANVVAAYGVGVNAFDSSCGGIGGCPFAPNATGNVATEDLAYLFSRMGVDTGIDLPKLIDTTKWLGTQLGKATPGMVGRAGGFPARMGT